MRGSSTPTAEPWGTPRPDTSVIATRYVLDGWPVHVVVRDHRGGWRVLGSQMFRVIDERLCCWETLLDLDPSLGTVPDLALGSGAYRTAPGLPWDFYRG